MQMTWVPHTQSSNSELALNKYQLLKLINISQNGHHLSTISNRKGPKIESLFFPHHSHLKKISSYPLTCSHSALSAFSTGIQHSTIDQPVQHCCLSVTDKLYYRIWNTKERKPIEIYKSRRRSLALLLSAHYKRWYKYSPVLLSAFNSQDKNPRAPKTHFLGLERAKHFWPLSINVRLPVMVIGAVLPKIHLTLKLQVRTSRNISAAVNRVRNCLHCYHCDH